MPCATRYELRPATPSPKPDYTQSGNQSIIARIKCWHRCCSSGVRRKCRAACLCSRTRRMMDARSFRSGPPHRGGSCPVEGLTVAEVLQTLNNKQSVKARIRLHCTAHCCAGQPPRSGYTGGLGEGMKGWHCRGRYCGGSPTFQRSTQRSTWGYLTGSAAQLRARMDVLSRETP